MQVVPKLRHHAAPSARSVVVSTFLAVSLACVVFLVLLGHRTLTDWDEGIYAEVSREMLSGSWLVPHWNGQVWFEKPPLMLWITAACFKLFGVGEFWARAGSAFSGVAITGMLHEWLLRRRGHWTAWLGTVALLSAFGFQHVCRVGEMDVLLSLGCCIALCGLTAVREDRDSGWLAVWGGFAIALMTKGGASVVLPLTVAVLAFVERWSRARFGLLFWFGLAFFLAAVLPWHLYLFAHFGHAFLDEYLGYHVLTRATHTIEGHETRWWYYFRVLLVSAMPGALLYPAAVARGLRSYTFRPWAVFALVVVGFFTILQTRLPHYVAPAYPAFAVLTAAWLGERWQTFTAHKRQPIVWAAWTSVALLVSIGSVLATSGARGRLHRAQDHVLPDSAAQPHHDLREPAMLLRGAAAQSALTPGPLLVWWEDDTRSIAGSVFYSGRPIVQVELVCRDRGVFYNRYTFNPVCLTDAVTERPRLLLLDKELVARIREEFEYRPIVGSTTMELGSIRRLQP